MINKSERFAGGLELENMCSEHILPFMIDKNRDPFGYINQCNKQNEDSHKGPRFYFKGKGYRLTDFDLSSPTGGLLIDAKRKMKSGFSYFYNGKNRYVVGIDRYDYNDYEFISKFNNKDAFLIFGDDSQTGSGIGETYFINMFNFLRKDYSDSTGKTFVLYELKNEDYIGYYNFDLDKKISNFTFQIHGLHPYKNYFK